MLRLREDVTSICYAHSSHSTQLVRTCYYALAIANNFVAALKTLPIKCRVSYTSLYQRSSARLFTRAL